MGFSIGSMVNTVANVTSRKSDSGKGSDSSLFEFMNAMSQSGIQIKSNFEVEFLQLGGFQFFCQSVNIPGLKSNNAELNYKGRSVQIPINCEQEHEFQFTVINDASGKIYATVRKLMVYDYNDPLYKIGDPESRRMLDNGYTVTVKARGDGRNTGGMNVVMNGVRITFVSGLDFSHSDATVQTFTVNGYVNSTDFQVGNTSTEDGLLQKVDKISGKVSSVLGK